MNQHVQPLRVVAIASTRHEVMFKDGTTVYLQPVIISGMRCAFRRVLVLPKGITMMFDLRHLVPGIGDDLCIADERDIPGIVFFSLRGRYETSSHLVRDVANLGRVLADVKEAA